MPSQLVILYCVDRLAPLLRTSATQSDAALQATAIAFFVGILLNVREITSLLLYLPLGHWTSRPGQTKKPFIGATFVFFALFPIALVTLGKLGVGGLVAAFVIAGFRELGEPARKAMITELVPADCRTQAIGLYWAARGAGIAPAGLVGGLIWYRFGPDAMLWTAGAIGVLGALSFYVRLSGSGGSRGRTV
jgi:MFS family permease